MLPASLPTIRVAAALIEDREGHLRLVRKRGTAAFMQAGGKIEPGESAVHALARELDEELGFAPAREQAVYLGRFVATAANEPGRLVEAELFRLTVPRRRFPAAAELEEVV